MERKINAFCRTWAHLNEMISVEEVSDNVGKLMKRKSVVIARMNYELDLLIAQQEKCAAYIISRGLRNGFYQKLGMFNAYERHLASGGTMIPPTHFIPFHERKLKKKSG